MRGDATNAQVWQTAKLHSTEVTATFCTQLATAPSRTLARIWCEIAHILDGDVTSLAEQQLLIWQPAHLPASAIGEAKCSDGRRLTVIDWRANRLADALAKQAARIGRADKETQLLARSAEAALLNAACNLGASTHAANNHKVEITVDGGGVATVTKRDSEHHERCGKRGRYGDTSQATAATSTGAGSSSVANARPWQPPPLPTRPAKRLKSAAARDKEVHEAGLQYLLQEKTKRMATGGHEEDVSHRREQIRLRVRARLRPE